MKENKKRHMSKLQRGRSEQEVKISTADVGRRKFPCPVTGVRRRWTGCHLFSGLSAVVLSNAFHFTISVAG